MLTLDRSFIHANQRVAWGRIGEGEPLVLIHGFPWSSQAWRRIAPWLAKRYTVYYFDMLGTGESDKFDGQDVSPPVQNDLLAALMTHWRLERPHVVGHDFGGLAALRGAFINGLVYGRLTLIDAVCLLPSGSPLFAQIRDYEEAFAGMPAYAHEALFRAFVRNAGWHPMADEVVDLYLSSYSSDKGQRAFYRQIAQADAKSIEEVQRLYAPLACPIDLIWGEHDDRIPVSQGETLARHLGVERLLCVPDAGHAIQEDAPESILAALLASGTN
ncbi:alpha/beta fold hydrolase [Salinicola halophyticus]|uniref:alpha/beta fold hydrolase n=1 Tax=Salinicola halophyticus TaxID=1808881 RepID=UPI003F481B67